MSESELQTTLVAILPVLSLEETPTADKCKYLIGTQSGVLMIKTTNVMIRVGGGFASLEDYIKQVGPFECIKLYKLMKGNPEQNMPPMSFKEAVAFYMKKLKSPDKIVQNFIDNEDEEQMGLFENSIIYLRKKQDEAKERFEAAQNMRKSSLKAAETQPGASGSPREMLSPKKKVPGIPSPKAAADGSP